MGKDTMHKAIMVKGFQWMRNAGSKQRLGNRQKIRVLDEFASKKFLLSKLRPDFASSLSEYQRKLPK